MNAHIRSGFGVVARLVTLLNVFAGVGASAAQAQSANWSAAATTGGSWGVPANWVGGVPASGAGNTATFALDFVSGSSVTLDGSRVIGTVESTSANPWSIDSGSGGVLSAANFTINGSGPVTVTAVMAGTSFTKDGVGTLIVANAGNAYTGPINLNAGIFSVVGSGNYAPGPVTVTVASPAILDGLGLIGGPRFGGPTTRIKLTNGDILTGTGTVNGGIKAESGSTVYPGDNGVGTLHVNGTAVFESGSFWKVKVATANPGSANTSNMINLNGSLTLNSGMILPVDGSGLTFTLGQTYDYTLATITGDFTIGDVIFQPSNFNPAMLNNPSMFSLLISGNSLILHFTPVPEPAFIVTICLGAAAGWRVVRKRLLWM